MVGDSNESTQSFLGICRLDDLMRSVQCSRRKFEESTRETSGEMTRVSPMEQNEWRAMVAVGMINGLIITNELAQSNI